MNKTLKIIGIIILILVIVGSIAVYLGWKFIGGFIERGPEETAKMFEKYEQEIPFEEIREMMEESQIEEIDTEQEDPYETAETVVPMSPRNETMHEHFKKVLGQVFEKDPKLVGSGDITALAYIVDRVITTDDVFQIRDLLQEEGYDLSGTDVKGSRYELSFSAEILDQEYRGNIFVIISTSQETEEYTQRIEVRIL